MTHYDELGVARTATTHELREAYRRAARSAHPDRHGEASAGRMAAVNEAWRVLGDPDRRRSYDAAIADRDSSPRSAPPRSAPPTATPVYERARVPWRFMLGLASVGVALVAVGVITYDPPPPSAPDGILRAGDCVQLTVSLEAVEVSCGVHDAVVERLIPFDQTCPASTQPYRDRQGMGTACVVVVAP